MRIISAPEIHCQAVQVQGAVFNGVRVRCVARSSRAKYLSQAQSHRLAPAVQHSLVGSRALRWLDPKCSFARKALAHV